MKLEVAIIIDGPEPRTEIVRGQFARTIRALVDAGDKGVTAIDVSSTWALRLAHYVFILRRRYDLQISTEHEAHHGAAGPGRHARYRLVTPVRIIADNSDARAA